MTMTIKLIRWAHFLVKLRYGLSVIFFWQYNFGLTIAPDGMLVHISLDHRVVRDRLIQINEHHTLKVLRFNFRGDITIIIEPQRLTMTPLSESSSLLYLFDSPDHCS